MPNPSELARTDEFNTRMTGMTKDIHKRLSQALAGSLEDFLSSYEPITYDAEFELVDFEPSSGFVPYTDGGFHTLVIYPASLDPAHRPAVFDDYMESLENICKRDFFHDQTGEWPADDVELNAYFDKMLYGDASLDEDKDLYYEYELEYFNDANPGLEIKVLYYAASNIRNDQGHDAICVSVQTNTDAPYYRDGAGQSIYEQWFKVDQHTPSVVSLHLLNALNEL